MTATAPFRLVYASHARWPLPPSPNPPPFSTRPIRVSVLDSSFNPPHSAHLALAQHGDSSFEARLLVLSTSNADKGSAEQKDVDRRLEMMVEMAKAMRNDKGQQDNVAVACIAEPLIIAKSRLLKSELEKLLRTDRGAEGPNKPSEVRLTFPLGWDTLIRFFAPRYYQPPSPPMATQLASFFDRDGSSIACARRGDVSSTDEQAFLDSDEVKPWLNDGAVELFDLPEDVQDVSSTAVRKAVKEGKWDEVERLVPFERVRDIIKRDHLYL